VLGAIVLQVFLEAIPAIRQFGLNFFTTPTWDPVNDKYGALATILGTLLCAFLALLLAVPVGMGVAIVLSEDFLPPKLQRILVFLVELLAAIPSVVFGLWGIFVLAPFIDGPMRAIQGALSKVPFFGSIPSGRGIYIASAVLALMILPIIAAIARDSLASVPPRLRQASYGLGATRWETLLQVIIPAGLSGIVGGILLALGRALGETMAVTMLIGNTQRLFSSIFDQSSTISSLLANQFAEADGLQVSALMYAALVLFVITFIVNVLAEFVVRRVKLNL
jgi:phosphate transport system permease protein